MPVVMTQSYGSGRVIRIPTQPQTIGDHIRRRRLGLKLLQREAAEQIGVCEPSIFNWESNRGTPEIRFMPAIIRFLDYNPLPEATTVAEQLVRHRTALGLSRNKAAKELGVDAGTLARWERGGQEPAGELLRQVERFLDGDETWCANVRRVG
jgi:transcriptional regulator with XRE-family HTH domain